MSSFGNLTSRPIRGLLLDITGVLYDSGPGPNGGSAVPGSVDAVQRLQDSHLTIRFCSNETSNTREHLVSKLRNLGFNLSIEQVFTPAPATVKLLKQRDLRPHLLVHPGVWPEFDEIDQNNPNCVVMGDAAEGFSYQNVNRAFQLLMEMQKPVLISMGFGKYYKETDGLKIDVGAYCKALEYAVGIQGELVGKPTASFFGAALDDMKLSTDEVVMIGDDIVGDIAGAQTCGLRAILVRTGKWRSEWEAHPEIKPDAICDDLSSAVQFLLEHKC